MVQNMAERLHSELCQNVHFDRAAETGGCLWGYYGHSDFWKDWFNDKVGIDYTHRDYVEMAITVCTVCDWDEKKVEAISKTPHGQAIAKIFNDPQLGLEKAKAVLAIILP